MYRHNESAVAILRYVPTLYVGNTQRYVIWGWGGIVVHFMLSLLINWRASYLQDCSPLFVTDYTHRVMTSLDVISYKVRTTKIDWWSFQFHFVHASAYSKLEQNEVKQQITVSYVKVSCN